jgi:hypothetical protein
LRFVPHQYLFFISESTGKLLCDDVFLSRGSIFLGHEFHKQGGIALPESGRAVYGHAAYGHQMDKDFDKGSQQLI